MNSIKKTVSGLLVAGVLFGAGACGGDDSGDSGGAKSGSASASSSPEAAKADLSGVPDVVASVNGEKISKGEFGQMYESQFQQASTQAQQSGSPVDQDQLKKQVAETMVGTLLLTQEAERRGFTTSADEVETALADLAKQNGLKSADQFLAALKKQGMDADEVRTEVGEQKEIEQLLAKEGGDAKPTDAELHKIYDQAKKQQQASGQKGGLPAFDKVRSQLVEQAKSEKQNEVAQKLVTSLRSKGKVTINL